MEKDFRYCVFCLFVCLLSLAHCSVYRTLNQVRISIAFGWLCFRGKNSLMTIIFWDLFGVKKATFQHFFEFFLFWAKQYKWAAEWCYCIFSHGENGILCCSLRILGYQIIRQPLCLEYLPIGFTQWTIYGAD